MIDYYNFSFGPFKFGFVGTEMDINSSFSYKVKALAMFFWGSLAHGLRSHFMGMLHSAVLHSTKLKAHCLLGNEVLCWVIGLDK